MGSSQSLVQLPSSFDVWAEAVTVVRRILHETPRHSSRQQAARSILGRVCVHLELWYAQERNLMYEKWLSANHPDIYAQWTNGDLDELEQHEVAYSRALAEAYGPMVCPGCGQ